MSVKNPTPEQVDAYAYAYVMNNGDQTKAFRKAFPAFKGTSKSAWEAGSRLQSQSKVSARIDETRKLLAEKSEADFGITAQAVIAQWWKIASADAADITQVRHYNCRHCHGFDNEFQWKNEAEFKASQAPNKDDFGGYGFRMTGDPAEDCPRCEGLGVESIWLEDTRNLNDKAAALYDGVKQTRNGIEIKTVDRNAALANIAKALGMFTENVNHRSPDGSMTPTVIERRIIDSADEGANE
jgi:phage terminase small subunit